MMHGEGVWYDSLFGYGSCYVLHRNTGRIYWGARRNKGDRISNHRVLVTKCSTHYFFQVLDFQFFNKSMRAKIQQGKDKSIKHNRRTVF